LVLLAERGTQSPIFIALGVGAVVLLKVVMTAAHRVHDANDRRLDHELQMSLLNHQMSTPVFSVDLVISLDDGEYKEPAYQSQIPLMASTQSLSKPIAKYN